MARDLAALHTCFYISDEHPSVLKDPRNGRGVPFRKRARAARLPPAPACLRASRAPVPSRRRLLNVVMRDTAMRDHAHYIQSY